MASRASNSNKTLKYNSIRTSNCRFRYGQSDIHKDYFYFVFDLFKSYCSVNPYESSRIDSRSGSVHKALFFNTMTLPCFNYYHDIFYKDKIKIVPKDIMSLLTPVGLAFLICDDGSFNNRDSTVTICTDSYFCR